LRDPAPLPGRGTWQPVLRAGAIQRFARTLRLSGRGAGCQPAMAGARAAAGRNPAGPPPDAAH
jgi:hypothetical protein